MRCSRYDAGTEGHAKPGDRGDVGRGLGRAGPVRAWVILREAWSSAWSALVPTVLITILVGVMCAATLATVGRSAAAEEQVAQRLDSAGSRYLAVADARDAGLLSPGVLAQTQALSTVERAVGTQLPSDVVNAALGAGGQRAPAWPVTGDLADVVDLTAGRWPGPGEALVAEQAQTTLGLEDPVGAVQGALATGPGPDTLQYAIVGSFTPREPFGNYAGGVLIRAEPGATSDTLHVVLADSDDAAATQTAVISLVAPPEPQSIQVTSPVSLAQIQAEVTGDLTTYGRTLLLGLLAAGAALVAVVVLADVLVRRKDLGRRRALGATRTTVVLIVTLRTLIPATLGAALGTATGIWAADRVIAAPPWTFSAAVAVLAVIAALASTLPPALYAATRDPVRVLRTP